MLNTLKRKIALGAVAAVGAAGLVTIAAPAANAALATPTSIVASALTSGTGGLRLAVTNTGAADGNGAAKWTVRFSSVPAASIAGNVAAGDTGSTSAISAGAIATGTANVVSVSSFTSSHTLIPGVYSGTVFWDNNGDASIDADDVSTSFTATVGGPAVSIALSKASASIPGAATGSASFTLKDASGNGTVLGSGANVYVTSSVTSGAGTFTLDTATGQTKSGSTLVVSSSATIGSSGAYTVTGSLSAAGTATLSFNLGGTLTPMGTAASFSFASVATGYAAGIKLATPANATSSNTVATPATTYAPASTGTQTLYVPQTSTSFGFTITGTAGTTVPVTVTSSTAGLVTAVNDSILLDASGAATYTVPLLAASTPASDAHFTVAVPLSAAITATIDVVFKAQNVNASSITVSPKASANILTIAGGSNAFTVTIKDQFGTPQPNYTVRITTDSSQRNASKTLNALTDANGAATLTLADASTSTSALTDVVAYDAFAPTNLGSDLLSSTVTVTYGTGKAAGLTLTGGSTTTTTWYAAIPAAEAVTASTAAGTSTAASPTNSSTVAITPAMTSDAVGTALAGVPIVYTGSAGVKFLATSTGNQADALATITVASNTAVYAFGTIPGVNTVTATGGGLTATRSFTVLAPVLTQARAIAITAPTTAVAGSPAIFSSKVTDGNGNTVKGVTVTFTLTGTAAFLNGSNLVDAVTDATGVATASVNASAAGDVSVTAAIKSGQNAEATDATNSAAGLPVVRYVAAVASATAVGTFKASTAGAISSDAATAAAQKATDAKIADIATAVTNLSTTVAGLVASLVAQIKDTKAAITDTQAALAALAAVVKRIQVKVKA